jgi:hypothetical protein
MYRGILPTFNVLTEFPTYVLPQWFPLMAKSPDILPLEERYFQAELLLKDCKERYSVGFHGGLVS